MGRISVKIKRAVQETGNIECDVLSALFAGEKFKEGGNLYRKTDKLIKVSINFVIFLT